MIIVAGQKAALGLCHAGQTVTIAVSDTTLAIELEAAETRVVRRTTTPPSAISTLTPSPSRTLRRR